MTKKTVTNTRYPISYEVGNYRWLIFFEKNGDDGDQIGLP